MSWAWTLSSWACLGVAAVVLGSAWFYWTKKQQRVASQLERCRIEGQLFKSLVELFDHPLILTDVKGNLTYANAAAEKLFEYPASEALGRPLALLAANRSAQLEGFLNKIRSGANATHCETIILSKSGRPVEVAITFTPIQDESRQLTGICILAYDISKRKRAEEALAKERFLVETLMENIPDHIYFKDRESRFLRINKAMSQTFLLNSPDEALGKTDFDFFLTEHARQAFDDEQEIIRSGQSLVGREEKETWPDGSVTWVSTTKVALRDQAGNIIGTFGISRDITDRKQAQEALGVKTQELQRSNTELEHFAYAASHDLQEPLRMIASYLQLLIRRCRDSLSPEGKEFIEYAVDGAKRMQALINDLLLYSRVGRHGKPFVPSEGSEILSRALANLKIAIEDSQAVVTSAPLPTVHGDPIQLAQLLQNLIGNAIKFRGSDPPRIHIAANFSKGASTTLPQAALGDWVFSVTDNGIGIESQYYERIFVIFQRLHTREEYPGTGIGLALCKRIVERHGGRIWVDSKPGKGSTFYFSIPQIQEVHA